MALARKGRDFITHSEVGLLYGLSLAMAEHKRRLVWDFEVFPHTPDMTGANVRTGLKKFSDKTGLLQRQRAPDSNHRGWVWCAEQPLDEWLYGELKNHPDKIVRPRYGVLDRPGWSPEEILKALEERKERNGIRKSEGESTPASTE